MSELEPSMNDLLRRAKPESPQLRALRERLEAPRDAVDPWGCPLEENEPTPAASGRLYLPDIPLAHRSDYELTDEGDWCRIFDLEELFGKERSNG